MSLIFDTTKYAGILPEGLTEQNLVDISSNLSNIELSAMVKLLDELLEYKTSPRVIKLPTDLNKPLFFVTMCRYEKEPIEGEKPEGCSMLYSELCSECPYHDKECVKGAYANLIWMHLDSPYLSSLLSQYGTMIFDSEDEAIDICRQLVGIEIADKCQELYGIKKVEEP